MSKYYSVKTVVDGITFSSKAEAKRYGELKLLEKGKVIMKLELQPSFDLNVNGVKIGKYVADFSYIIGKTLAPVVEDVKGVKTALYRRSKKHFEAQYGLTITEITRKVR